MNQFSSLYAACSYCRKMVTARRPIQNGVLCNECYAQFAKSTAVPAGKTLDELQQGRDADDQRRTEMSLQPPGPAASTPQSLSTVEKLQFRKFVADQGGMTPAEAATFLDSISPAEQNELVAEFKRSRASSSATSSPQQIGLPPQVNISVDTEAQVACPNCRSKNTTNFKQGYGVGKAAVGAVLAGPFGLLAGGINMNKIHLKCLQCGHHWTPGPSSKS